jgi:hypothetical protein
MHRPARHLIRKFSPLIAVAVFVSASALAHIKNEATQFPDIEFSDARFDIVVLVGAGIIPETPVFEPDKALSKLELATWVALAEGLLPGGETPDTDALAAAALAQGFLDSLEGGATIADVDRLFFAGQLDVADAGRTPTKAEAASLIATALDSEAGAALLDKRNLAVGGNGAVTAVGIEEGHHGDAYVITIDGTTLQMDAHGRVANGPTDLLQWEGRSVLRAFTRGSGDNTQWLYLEAEPATASEPVRAAAGVTAVETAADVPVADRSLLYWLIAAVIILAIILFFRRRQSD